MTLCFPPRCLENKGQLNKVEEGSNTSNFSAQTPTRAKQKKNWCILFYGLTDWLMQNASCGCRKSDENQHACTTKLQETMISHSINENLQCNAGCPYAGSIISIEWHQLALRSAMQDQTNTMDPNGSDKNCCWAAERESCLWESCWFLLLQKGLILFLKERL